MTILTPVVAVSRTIPAHPSAGVASASLGLTRPERCRALPSLGSLGPVPLSS